MSTRTVVSQLNERLAPLGFERRKRTWNRKVDATIHVIDVQSSKGRESFTVNAGVMAAEVYEKCWGKSAPAFVDEPSCIVRTRIGRLIGDKDIWWETSDPEAAKGVGQAVQSYVLPFFEGIDSRRAMLSFLVATNVRSQKYPPPIIYLAILKSELGDHGGACSTLSELHEEALGAWPARISEVSERLGCA